MEDPGRVGEVKKQLLIIIAAAVFVTGACSSDSQTDATRDESGEITEQEDIGVFRIRTGDCLMLPGELGSQVETLEAIPCAEPHNAEVLTTTMIADGDYPGLDAVIAQAEEDCLREFQRITGNDFMTDPDWDMTFLYPTQESWEQIDDREIVCIVTPLAGGTTTTLVPRR